MIWSKGEENDEFATILLLHTYYREDIIQYLSQNLGIKHETGEENCTEERKMHLQIN